MNENNTDLQNEPSEEPLAEAKDTEESPTCADSDGEVAEKKVYVRRAADKNRISLGACIVLIITAMLFTFMLTYVLLSQNFVKLMREKETSTGGLTEESYTKIAQIEQMLGEEFLYEIDEGTLTDSTIKGYMYGLGDPYAEYFTAEEFEVITADTNAEMQGIGISVTYHQEYNAIYITSVFPESPALEAGVRPGDLIFYVKVDGEMVSVASLGYTMAVTHLQGEAGTLAEFVVYRGDDLSESQEFSIERGFITEYTVTSKIHPADSTVGIIQITSFDLKTPEQFKAAVDDLTSKGCEKLVIDVRNNPGGELVSVCTTLDMLVPEGPVIRTVDKDGNEEIVYTSDENEIDIPMAVLMNGNTASAGELFAATLKDYDKAVLVGTTTFGKGSMQTIKSFNDGTAFKYTYRYYCPPFSDNYDQIGIEPDVISELSEDMASKFYSMTVEEDTQLKAAIEALK